MIGVCPEMKKIYMHLYLRVPTTAGHELLCGSLPSLPFQFSQAPAGAQPPPGFSSYLLPGLLPRASVQTWTCSTPVLLEMGHLPA